MHRPAVVHKTRSERPTVRRFVLLLLVLVVGVACWAPVLPASAVTTPTRPSTVPTGARFLGGSAWYDPVTGDIYEGDLGIVSPVASKVPSSALAAANGAGGTVSQDVAGATGNAALTDGTVSMAGRVFGTVATVAAGLQIGLTVGGQVDKIECHFGVSGLCRPTGGPAFVPNFGIATVANPGFVPIHTAWSGTDCDALPASVSSATVAAGTGMTLQSDGSGNFDAVVTYGGMVGRFRCGLFPQVSVQCDEGGGTLGPFVSWIASSGQAQGDTELEIGPASPSATGLCQGPGQSVYRVLVPIDGAPNDPTASEALAYYYPPGSAGRPADVPANPTRHWHSSATCSDGSTVTADSADFTETDASFPAFPDVTCAAGSTATSIIVTEESAGLSPSTVWTYTEPAPVSDWRATYPLCGTGACTLGLLKTGPTGTATGDCFQTAGLCADWFTDPDKSSNYQCTYGPAGAATDVALSECNLYSPTFDVQEQAKGVPYGDPATGDIPTSLGDPDTSPVGGGSGDGSSCFPSGWSAFNPVEWVYDPIKCALVWAFVPDSATLSSFTGNITTAYNATSIGEWFSALSVVGVVIVPSGGCGGAVMHIPSLVGSGPGQDVTVFGTCDEPWHTIALLVKAFLIVMIGWGTLVGVFRNVSSAFGLSVDWGRKNGD
jgi:hypothetical protein